MRLTNPVSYLANPERDLAKALEVAQRALVRREREFREAEAAVSATSDGTIQRALAVGTKLCQALSKIEGLERRIRQTLLANPYTSPYDRHQIRVQRDSDGLWWVHLYTEPGGGEKPGMQTFGGYDGYKAYGTAVDFALRLGKDLRAQDPRNPHVFKVYDENGVLIAEM